MRIKAIQKKHEWLTDLENVRVETLELLPERVTLVRIIDQGVGSIENGIHAFPIGETFEEGSEL